QLARCGPEGVSRGVRRALRFGAARRAGRRRRPQLRIARCRAGAPRPRSPQDDRLDGAGSLMQTITGVSSMATRQLLADLAHAFAHIAPWSVEIEAMGGV